MSERREGHGFQYWLSDNSSQSDPVLQPNQSWLFSDQGRRAISNPDREPRESVVEDRDEIVANDDENVETTREYSFRELDDSLIFGVNEETRRNRPATLSRISERTESASTSYDSSIFDPRELNNEITMAQPPNDVTAQIEDGEPPRRQINIDGNVTIATNNMQENLIETQIGVLADAINEMRTQTQVLQEHLHQQILNLHDRINTQINGIQGQQQGSTSNRELNNASRGAMNAPEVNVSYGQGPADVRNRLIHPTNYMQLKEARGMIPEIDGTSQSKIQEFLDVTTFAMGSINPTDEPLLLKAILYTKLKGKVRLDFQTRSIQTYEQLKQELESCYTTRKSITHLQLEFNTLKQRQGESAKEYGLRADRLAMQLYESTIEGKGYTALEKDAIKKTIQGQALQNFQLGLQSEIKLVVRSRNYNNLQEAIAVAASEEKMKGPSPALNKFNAYSKTANSTREKTPQCAKCGKWGHIGRECRSSRFANRFSLPKADGHKVNALEKYCKYCKKPGHFQEECWQLNGRPERRNAKENAQHKQTKENKAKKADSDEEDDAANKKKTRPLKALVAHTDKTAKIHANLNLIALPIVEAKNEHATMLVDTGATLTLIKTKSLLEETPVYDETVTLVGATGQKADTLGVIKAHITLKDKTIMHKMHVVKDDFPIGYEGILGADFLNKYVTKWDYPVKKLTVEGTTFKLFPHNNIKLAPRSETIVKASTGKNELGIVHAMETQPGVIIGSCIVKAEDYCCPVSVINTTDKEIDFQTPFVNIEKFEELKEEVHTIGTVKEETTPMSREDKVKNLLRIDHLNKGEKKAILEISENYCDIFHLEGEPLSSTQAMKHEIATRAGASPANTRPYRLPEKHKEEVSRQVTEMLNNKIIRPSLSQWNAPLLVVPKKPDASGKAKLRVVVDFRKLNDLTIGDSFPLPNITDILDQLGNSKYFTTLDLASGYHQIPMAEKDREKTAFSTPYGHYEFNRMPFGLKNAPATFQRLMNTILAGIQGLRCLVYLDDIVIYGASLEDHNRRLIEVFERIRENNLKLQPDKCEFLRKEVVYLGHIITEGGIKPDPGKIQAVKNFPTPKKVKDIQSFIGLAGYYRKFIENFSKIVKPLTKLTKKGVKFEWTQEQKNAFEHLKSKLITAPVLNYPDFNNEFIVTTDASDFAIGAILSQGKIGQDRPIAYASRLLSKAEQNYNTTEKELLAIVWAVKHFRPYVYGTKFKIVTDHKPLVWLFNVTDPGSRLIRWRLKLEEYDYEIVHKAGKSNTNADALSRNVAHGIHTVDGERESEEEEEEEEEEDKKEKGKIYTEEEKQQILYEYHDAPIGGHQGIQRTIKRIRLTHNWKGLTKDVEKYISKCEYCQKNKLKIRNKAPMILTDTPDKPFEKCALDIVGPMTETENGNKYILTFQDHLTKFSKAMPIRNQEASTIAREFVTKIVLEYGIPDKILTDQGTNFLSEVFKNTCKLLKIEKIRTSAYHPESNGALERSHRTLAEYLRHYINEDQSDWDNWLPFAMFAYNTTPHTATGYTPFELVYGHRATLPTALTYPSRNTYTYDDYISELREKMRAAHELAKAHAKEEKLKAKKIYDRKTKENDFKAGDKVLLHDEALRRGRSKKLDSLWKGPYLIIKKNSDVNYTIKMGRKSMIVHANRLKLFIEQ